ncbi:MAG: hypothetical protein J0M23_06585 [Rickettsiales bacterium]|nr:hypothetical protein [Rickettsiales bacterium]
MSKNDDDPMKKILERRKFIDDEREVEDDDPSLDIPDRAEQPSKRKEERAAREEPSSPLKKGPDVPDFDLGDALRKQMGNFKIPSVREKPKTELDLEDAWADEPLEESRPIIQREEAPVKKEPGKINVTDGRFDNVAGLFGGGKKKEQPKVGKLRTEAIEALANAKAEDARRAAEREESPGEPRVSVTSAELQKGPDIPIPPAPPPAPPLKTTEEPRVSLTSRESVKDSEVPVPPSPPPAPTLEANKEPRVSLTSRESVKGSEIPVPPAPPPAPTLEERRTTVAMEEPPIPSVEKRKTTVSKIPGAEGNKDLDIVIEDLEKLQQEVSDKIGPKNAKELASKIDKIKEDYNAKSGEEQTKTLYQNLESLKDWSSKKGKETNDKSTWKKIGTVISSCMSLVAAKIAGKEVEAIKNNLAQAMKELKTQGKKEVVEGLSKINTRAAENQPRGR